MNKKIKLFLSLSLIPLLLSCYNKKIDETRDYSDYLEYKVDLDSFFNYKKTYGIYIYQYGCRPCEETKGYVFDYLDKIKHNNDRKLESLYFVELHPFNSLEGKEQRNKFKQKPAEYNSLLQLAEEDNFKGKNYVKYISFKNQLIQENCKSNATKLEEIYFFGTPSLYIIENQKVIDFCNGRDSVKRYLING
ncbi:MAG: hypothetical protein ACTTID_00910 [Bacillales bacterium]